MNTLLALLAKYGGSVAMGYILPRVTQKLSGSIWGRVLIYFARNRQPPSPAETLLQKLGKDVPLTEAQLQRLTPAERDLLNHTQ